VAASATNLVSNSAGVRKKVHFELHETVMKM